VVSGFPRPLTGDHITAILAVLGKKSGRADLNRRPLEPHSSFPASSPQPTQTGRFWQLSALLLPLLWWSLVRFFHSSFWLELNSDYVALSEFNVKHDTTCHMLCKSGCRPRKIG